MVISIRRPGRAPRNDNDVGSIQIPPAASVVDKTDKEPKHRQNSEQQRAKSSVTERVPEEGGVYHRLDVKIVQPLDQKAALFDRLFELSFAKSMVVAFGPTPNSTHES